MATRLPVDAEISRQRGAERTLRRVAEKILFDVNWSPEPAAVPRMARQIRSPFPSQVPMTDLTMKRGLSSAGRTGRCGYSARHVPSQHPSQVWKAKFVSIVVLKIQRRVSCSVPLKWSEDAQFEILPKQVPTLMQSMVTQLTGGR